MLDLVLQAKSLIKSMDGHKILNDISIDVERGELISIIGPSGCGKSTFLRCLNFMEHPDSGSVTVDNIHLGGTKKWDASHEVIAYQLRAHVGMVFQEFNLFPHKTVLENVMLAPIHVREMSFDQAEKNAMILLDKVGLSDVMNRHPAHLSGGQKQRAAIARALAMRPSVMLYDEPTSALDPELSEEVLSVMRTLDDEGMTQIIVTHDMRFARVASDRIIFMEDGRIIESGSPETILTAPHDSRTKRFLRTIL